MHPDHEKWLRDKARSNVIRHGEAVRVPMRFMDSDVAMTAADLSAVSAPQEQVHAIDKLPSDERSEVLRTLEKHRLANAWKREG